MSLKFTRENVVPRVFVASFITFAGSIMTGAGAYGEHLQTSADNAARMDISQEEVDSQHTLETVGKTALLTSSVAMLGMAASGGIAINRDSRRSLELSRAESVSPPTV